MTLEYHEICLWSPFYQETVDKISKGMTERGFDPKEPVSLYEGKILDGRHRYLAALKAGVEPVFEDFTGTREEAIKYVIQKQRLRNHWSSEEKEYHYVKTSEALGVQSRGGDRGNQYQSGNVSNDTMAPSQQDYADSLGVSRPTVARWEKDRKEIKSDPELSKVMDTPEGYKQAKDVVKQRREAIRNTVPPKVVDLDAMSRDTTNTDIRKVGPAFIATMETLCTKFDRKDIERELTAFMEPDPLGLKVKALHKMAEILTDLCDDYPILKSTNVN